jgi:AraC-like DNA-binding protein
MTPAASIEEFLAAPIGKWIAGKSFVIWAYSPSLAGSVYFGRPGEDDFPALLQMAPLPLHPAFAAPFDAVIDCTRIEGLSAQSFEVLVRYLGEVHPIVGRIRRVVVVRPSSSTGNMASATLGGLFHEWVATRFPAALFTDGAEAFRWLKRPRGDVERGLVDATLAQALGVPPLLRGLRDWLSAQLQEGAAPPSVLGAARSLGLSPRSLQRHLHEAGTRFRAEVDRARVRAAEGLLIDGDAKLEAIARQVGCASLSHFSTLFRRATGEAPSDFRQRRR